VEALPPAGLPAEQVLAELAALRERDLPTHGGRLFAYVYDSGLSDVDELATSAYALAAHVNGLDPTAFPSLLILENSLVGAAASLLGGGPDVVGSVTSGGSESLILAVKAARDSRPDLAHPRLVLPASAHPAFAKAASYLRLGLDVVPLDPVTLRPRAEEVAAAIGPDTVLVACSAPSYAHGVVDPVGPIAAAAAERGVRCHVDACLGGWTLPYLRRLGVDVPPFDLSVPGVTSISVDLHKYAYCPKGTSLLLYRDADARAPQYFAYADWPGYPLVNSVVASTRSGGPIAAAWATMRHIGDDGYLELASRTLESARAIATAVSTVGGLRLLGDLGESTVVAFVSADPELDVFVLADELAARGWHAQPQPPYADLPASMHLTVTAAVAPRIGEFATALGAAAEATRAHGPARVPDDILAAVELFGQHPEALTPDVVARLAAGLGLGGGLPSGRVAVVNAVLAAASPRLRERLLIEFVALLQRPTHPAP
jgi:glutamate/tyrosine decarboxylase-like PLP-dependent enzyme